jgi:hypothetical protein
MQTQDSSTPAAPRKLTLKRETLRSLTQDELRQVAGGRMKQTPAEHTYVISSHPAYCCN